APRPLAQAPGPGALRAPLRPIRQCHDHGHLRQHPPGVDAHSRHTHQNLQHDLGTTQRLHRRTGGNPMTATTHAPFIVAALLVIMAALLWILPAQAQCDPSCSQVPEPPITGTASSTLYLPAVARNWHAWFTDSELDAAMVAAGYDVQTASMHTNCLLDVTAVPPYLIRYTSC